MPPARILISSRRLNLPTRPRGRQGNQTVAGLVSDVPDQVLEPSRTLIGLRPENVSDCTVGPGFDSRHLHQVTDRAASHKGAALSLFVGLGGTTLAPYMHGRRPLTGKPSQSRRARGGCACLANKLRVRTWSTCLDLTDRSVGLHHLPLQTL